MPEDPWPQMGIAAACGQLNHREMARAAIELVRKHQLLYLDLKCYREDAEKWFADTSIVDQRKVVSNSETIREVSSQSAGPG